VTKTVDDVTSKTAIVKRIDEEESKEEELRRGGVEEDSVHHTVKFLIDEGRVTFGADKRVR
jgi:hypothetical protein